MGNGKRGGGKYIYQRVLVRRGEIKRENNNYGYTTGSAFVYAPWNRIDIAMGFFFFFFRIAFGEKRRVNAKREFRTTRGLGGKSYWRTSEGVKKWIIQGVRQKTPWKYVGGRRRTTNAIRAENKKKRKEKPLRFLHILYDDDKGSKFENSGRERKKSRTRGKGSSKK